MTVGQQVLVEVLAGGVSQIDSVEVKIDNQIRPLDRFGRTTFVPTAPARFLVKATAIDVDSRIGNAEAEIKVRDLNDQAAPEVSIELPATGAVITQRTEIRGLVEDDNLDQFQYELSRQFGNQT